MTNIEIIQEVYKNFGQGNIAGVLAHFDKDVVWVRPGEPDIPFSGTFNGMEGLGKMLTLLGRHIRLKAFTPQKFFSNENAVAVFGCDTAEAVSTGKIYTSDWVQLFTLNDGKITRVQVYMDTLAIARAFTP